MDQVLYTLVRVDGNTDQKIEIKDTETVLGRGQFLQISEKKISRNHALLSFQNGKLNLKSTHSNPCIVTLTWKSKKLLLKSGGSVILNNGDQFSLLNGEYCYEVVFDNDVTAKQQNSEENANLCQSLNATADKKVNVDLNILNTKIENSKRNNDAENKFDKLIQTKCKKESLLQESNQNSDGTSVTINSTPTSASKNVKQESQSPTTLPTKKRKLPSWMSSSPRSSTQKLTTQLTPKKTPKRSKIMFESDDDDDSINDIPFRTPKMKSEQNEKNDKEISSKLSRKSRHDCSSSDGEIPIHVFRQSSQINSEDQSSHETSENSIDELSTSGKHNKNSENEINTSENNSNDTHSTSTPDNKNEENKINTPEKQNINGNFTNTQDSSDINVSPTASSSSNINPQTSSSSSSNNIPQTSSRTPCMYGASCYRKNPVHFQEFSHPSNSDYYNLSSQNDSNPSDDNDKPECEYGLNCYRKNPLHRQQYKHTRRLNPQRASKNNNDSSEEDEYDLEDSFIDSSEEGILTDEESDWHPSQGGKKSDNKGEDGESESDVDELVQDAKNFSRNKKLWKK